MNSRGWLWSSVVGLVLLVGACSSTPEPVKQPTLNPPPTANPTARLAITEGNEIFATGKWGAAKEQYEKAIQAQSTVAEAHYNLGLTLDRMGNRQEARPHYMEAANLAPGHQVIWNSPVLRRYGDVKVDKKSKAAPALPSLGGSGGIMGGGAGQAPGGN